MNKLSRSDCRLKWGNMVLDLHSRFQTERGRATEQPEQVEDEKSDAGNETDVGEAEPVKEKKTRKPRRKPEQ